jgi:XapX domain-containing protein
MKMYVVALAVGLLVGAIYGLLHVRSPAPPVVALVGLLGMLVGEQLVPLAREAITGRSIAAYLNIGAAHHVFGKLPDGQTLAKTSPENAAPASDRAAT